MFFRIRLGSLAPLLVLAACGGKTTDAPVDDGGGVADSGRADPGRDSGVPPDDAPRVDSDHPDAIHVTHVEKLDLLLAVDNSQSMGDKQELFARVVPQLVKTILASGAIKDLHVGVITSSLGSYGTSACDPSFGHNDDRGHLLPRADDGVTMGYRLGDDGSVFLVSCPSPVAASPLTWTYAGPSGADTAVGVGTSCIVRSVAQDGCGYESQLESLYHFLFDPRPFAKAAVKCTFGVSGDACGTNKIEVTGIDDELLTQRAAFLRPDSALSVVMLTDENDASLKPAQLNWIPWAYGKGQMQRGWKGCESVPDDFEPETAAEFATLHSTYGCYSCFERTDDPARNCTVPWAKDPLNADVDGRNLRESLQVQRFGYNFLWGRQRYVDGFTKTTLPGVSDTGGVVAMPNPIYVGGYRTPDLVRFTAIVGVPPNLVEDASGTPRVLDDAAWQAIVSADPAKRDPHMIVSIAPRAGLPKYAGDRSVDPVHGGDRDILDGDDIQFACIGVRATTERSDDCGGPNPEAYNPLCDAGGMQTRYKAFPGLRVLRVARELGAQGNVASICSTSLAKLSVLPPGLAHP